MPLSIERAKALFWGLLEPWMFLALAASYIPATILTLVQEREFGKLLSFSAFQDAWFGRFWAWAGMNVKNNGEAHVVPLLEGRTHAGAVTAEPTGPGIGGLCLELGAGSGFWVDIFSNRWLDVTSSSSSAATKPKQRPRSARSRVTRVYGVEPNAAQHPALRRAIRDAGLEGVYEIAPVGIQDLADPKKWDGRVAPGSVDAVVSVLCLCSIPDPERNIRALYELLKPGGRWYIYEHVRCGERAGFAVRLYQRLINLVWPYFLCGCQLTRPTDKTIEQAGPWSKIDVGSPPAQEWWATIPHVLGVYTK
ncbi:methyltransferase domain-containing protein [Xylariomycetidae sp. FL0641]|nr:methyltransferase domain-containing protein [Xylariomycetidae sp. FL0641]